MCGHKLLVRRLQLAAAEKLEAFARRIGEVVDKRVRAGEDPPLRTLALRAELAKARQVVLAVRQAERASALELAEVVGWPEGVPLQVTGELPRPAMPREVPVLVRAAVARHPARAWLAEEVRAAAARVVREDREARPDPALGVRYAREPELDGAAHVWLGTLSLPLPIWARNQGGRARARAELEVARARGSAFERALGQRVALAASRVRLAVEKLDIYGADILAAFDQNLDKLRRAFEFGGDRRAGAVAAPAADAADAARRARRARGVLRRPGRARGAGRRSGDHRRGRRR